MILNAKQIKKNIAWLLSNGSAPIKYLTHKHLLGADCSSNVMRKLWHEVENSPCVQEIFEKQEKDGSWHAGGTWAHSPSYAVKGGIDPYTPKYVTTTWILPLLGEMGYSAKDKRILKACRFTVSHGYFRDPLFRKPIEQIGRSRIDLSPCRFAQYLMALGAVGFVDDLRAKKGYEVLLCMQREDGGWVFPRHYDMMGWTRSCPYSSYHVVMALYCSRDPAHKKALRRGLEFLVWHLSTKRASDLQQFFYHGHNTVRELVAFSELGVGLRTKAVKTILKWLRTMYDAREGCFRYAGKPVSQYSNKKDGIDSRVAKYRLYHVIETDWFTYHMTRIAANMINNKF
jgi:hypothetical protein